MIGLDTNVLVRYFAQDDAKQSLRATKLMDALTNAEPGFVGLVPVVELVWVMQGAYSRTKADILALLEDLLQTAELVIENAEVVAQAVSAYGGSNADFADCLIERSAHYANCTSTVTLDERAARTAGMVLLGSLPRVVHGKI
jgi:predicted nucleic-acid-binding protein